MVTQDELTKMKVNELNEEAQKATLEYVKLRLAVTTRQSNKTAELKKLRRHIARARTHKRMLELEAKEQEPTGKKK